MEILDTLKPSEYFLSLIASDDKLKDFKDDLGLLLLAKDLEYKVDISREDIKDAIKQVYAPDKEDTLLAHLALRTGYLRFKKPLKIRCELTSNDAVALDKDTRFTDGNYVYYLDDYVALPAGIPKTVTMTLKEVHTIEQTLDKGTIYSHIPLPITYKECIGIRCFNGDTELTYSQNFAKWGSHFSIETLKDTKLQVVLKLEDDEIKEDGTVIPSLVKLGETIKVQYETSFDVDTPPDGVTIIETGYDIVADNIRIAQNYQPPLNKEDMQYLIRYHRKNLGDLVLNEDFRQLFIREVEPLKVIKVWQQREEAKYAGFNTNQINTVYVCYITQDNNTRKAEVDEQLKRVLEDAIYGRNLVIRDASIINIEVNITIKTHEAYSALLQDEVIDAIVGYYDDTTKPISKTRILQTIIPILNKNLNIYELDFDMTDKGDYAPRKIYKIETVNITFEDLG
jgi:hypothetical protein